MKENTNNGATPSAEISNQENVFVALDEDTNKFINPGYSNDGKGKRKPVETDPVASNSFCTVVPGDPLDNFLKNFVKRFEDPRKFTMLCFPAAQFPKVFPLLKKYAEGNDPAAIVAIAPYEITPDGRYYRSLSQYNITEDRFPWAELMKNGVTRKTLKKFGESDNLRSRRKSRIMFRINRVGDNVKCKGSAKLRLDEDGKGAVKLAYHFIRQIPEFNEQVMGHTFTGQEQDMLVEKLALDHLVEMEDPKTKQKEMYAVGYDEDTRELAWVKQDNIFIPKKLNGQEVTEQEQEILRRGGIVERTGKDENGEAVTIPYQYNADKRRVVRVYSLQERLNFKQQNWEKLGYTHVLVMPGTGETPVRIEQISPDATTSARKTTAKKTAGSEKKTSGQNQTAGETKTTDTPAAGQERGPRPEVAGPEPSQNPKSGPKLK